MDIIIDTREKKPYSFPDHKEILIPLVTGDYSLATNLGSLDKFFVIERKGLIDLEHCIYEDRFDKQVSRLAEIPYSYLLIEGYPATIKRRAKFLHKSPIAMLHKLYSIQAFSGVPVIFVENRQEAQDYVEYLCKAFIKKALKRQLDKLSEPVIMEIYGYYTQDGEYRKMKKCDKINMDGVMNAGITKSGSNKQVADAVPTKMPGKKGLASIPTGNGSKKKDTDQTTKKAKPKAKGK